MVSMFRLGPIKTVDDVKAFAKYLICDLRLNIHPDDPLDDFSHTLNESQLAYGYVLMSESFDVCEKYNADIYEIFYEYLN